MDTPENVWLLIIIGGIGFSGTIMRLVRAYGEELLEFFKWVKSFIDELKRLRGS